MFEEELNVESGKFIFGLEGAVHWLLAVAMIKIQTILFLANGRGGRIFLSDSLISPHGTICP